jgi:hypothetical protein
MPDPCRVGAIADFLKNQGDDKDESITEVYRRWPDVSFVEVQLGIDLARMQDGWSLGQKLGSGIRSRMEHSDSKRGRESDGLDSLISVVVRLN